MLRRKLLLILGSLVILLLAVAMAAVFMLQGLLGDLHSVRDGAMASVQRVNQMGGKIAQVQIDLYRLQLGSEKHLDSFLDNAEALRRLVDDLARYDTTQPGVAEHVQALRDQLPEFYRQISALATSQDSAMSRQYNQAALTSTVRMNEEVLQVADIINKNAQQLQTALIERFRWMVLGLAIAFLIVLNVSVLVLLRTADMVLRPVDRLIAASRALGEGRFDTRVSLSQSDEFGELAQAFNNLSERLQAGEERKLEVLRQVALTLNHELNNAMAIIELQLDLLKRSAASQGQDKYLRQIGESLKRMTRTVEALNRVRRIVLMDYAGGLQMLDLERSVADDGDSSGQVSSQV